MDAVECELKVIAPEGGTSAFEEWYEGIRDTPTRLRIRARLTRVQNGNFGDHKIFSGGIGELRLDFGPGYRVYFVQDGATVVFLLASGDKSRQLVDIQGRGVFGRRIRMKIRDFNETFAYELRDPEFAAAYLATCLQYEGFETFLTGLKNVAQANGGMTKLAEATSLGRESLYKTLSAQGNPEFKTLNAILSALGMRFSIVRDDAAAEAPRGEDAPLEALQAA